MGNFVFSTSSGMERTHTGTGGPCLLHIMSDTLSKFILSSPTFGPLYRKLIIQRGQSWVDYLFSFFATYCSDTQFDSMWSGSLSGFPLHSNYFVTTQTQHHCGGHQNISDMKVVLMSAVSRKDKNLDAINYVLQLAAKSR